MLQECCDTRAVIYHGNCDEAERFKANHNTQLKQHVVDLINEIFETMEIVFEMCGCDAGDSGCDCSQF